MELIKRFKIKRNNNLLLNFIIIILYPFILLIGLIIILIAWIISLFQTNQKQENLNNTSNLEWTFLVENKNIQILKRYINEIRFGPAYFHLKSEPIIPELKNKIFGDWFFIYENFIFIQEWNSTTTADTNLIVIDSSNNSYKILHKNLSSVLWEMKNESDLLLICNTGYETETYKINKNSL
ncbi:hypothetical protein [Moheibacter sediminis]|uniref:Uncharacterized protein n=1 Tax=Moheibacter sediminis TaxID=1434700 RepID=A0A1W2AD63_9FLAO|nr:hypothetical protein [Moheibacter sediminis]SMC58665.1 hypothetical protein SAMN06296427_10476 [Moheibacter sediminis]